MAAERKRLVKLVRDRVAQFVGKSTVSYEPVDEATHIRLLRRKLIEEAAEYLENPSLGEAADVLETLRALADWDLKVPWPAVAEEAHAKYEERGGFDDGIAMFATTTAPSRHEGEHSG